MLACFGLEDSKVLVLDMRSPGQPVAELIGHQAPLGAIAWGAGGDQTHSAGGYIASCGALSFRSHLHAFTAEDAQATTPNYFCTISLNPYLLRPAPFPPDLPRDHDPRMPTPHPIHMLLFRLLLHQRKIGRHHHQLWRLKYYP